MCQLKNEDVEVNLMSQTDPPEDEAAHQGLRRLMRTSKQPMWMKDFVEPSTKVAVNLAAIMTQPISPNFNYSLAVIAPQVNPTLFSQAVKFPHWVGSIIQRHTTV